MSASNLFFRTSVYEIFFQLMNLVQKCATFISSLNHKLFCPFIDMSDSKFFCHVCHCLLLYLLGSHIMTALVFVLSHPLKPVKGNSSSRLPIKCCSSGIGRGPPVSPAVSNRQSPFPRNVPSRSTFHSGQNRQRNHTQSYGQTTPMQSQDTSAISHSGRTSSFFSKLSSRFSKR